MNASTADSACGKSHQGLILALETTDKSASVAIEWEDGRSVLLETDRVTGSARTLAPAIEAILKKYSVDVSELAAIAVTVGPGSFTGLRVGVTMAKTMAYALKIPTIAVDSLETIAWKAAHDFSRTDGKLGQPEESFKIWTVLDAYRGELFAAFWEFRFKDTVVDCKALVPSQLVNAVQWSDSVANRVHSLATNSPDKIVLAGPGLARCRQLVEARKQL